ncbi:T9SS C-terminal target domain-containing protein [Dyadobacter luticola]|uniref:T9SS C-terminal target domain-containing protein n=1 Tax=Dyadobacter luticola TaxID=1979387 RepID=A0A5R9KVU1_9BACT|nr:T9SS C-terminal target domain-containing protein [Dyadobacter luticola]TLV00209.1 T9SS C-terminal target domain-containing protein [Dyadobacter luticola]
MKTVFLKRLTWSVLLLATPCLTYSAHAQADKKGKSEDKNGKSNIHIEVKEDDNGKVKSIRKDYKVDAMSDDERDKFVEKVLDSLGVDKGKKQSISIIVDDDEDDTVAKKKRKVIIDHRDDRDPLAFHWDNNLSYDFDSKKFKSGVREFEREFRPKARVFMKDMENFGNRMGDVWEREVTKPASVRSLTAYSNNPDNGILNLRFVVPDKGDVRIAVTDTRGKEVGVKEIKDFEGEFVGQIELKKNTKGTLFVTVVQNEDGMVKRIVIP